MATLKRPLPLANIALSSSPAFGTPLQAPPAQRAPAPPPPAFKPAISTILPILLPPPTLRPLAFRTFTKKHNLTLNASALQALAAFVGRHCGNGWREEGTAEKVLEEVAKLWKAEANGVIVEDGDRLKAILKTLESCMNGGRIGLIRKGSSNLSRHSSFAFGNDSAVDLTHNGARRPSLGGEGRSSSFGISALQVEDSNAQQDEEEESNNDPRAWLKVISAFEQPRFTYDVEKKHFIPAGTRPSPFPPASHKTAIFRDRYNVIHQRLLRNEAFQAPSFTTAVQHSRKRNGISNSGQQTHYKLTPIANLLGRGGTSHLLLAQLSVSPTGTLILNDLSGSIHVSLEHASSFQGGDDESKQPYFCPGMIVLVDGVYEEDCGVGGTIGGRFIAFGIGGPPVERREGSFGGGETGGGFGWTDFLGVGCERAIGQRMRRLERRLLTALENEDKQKMVIMAECTLDQPTTLAALRKVLHTYSDAPPLTFMLMGNFLSSAAMTGIKDTDSIAYKEAFNELAALLSDYPSLLKASTFVFVPGDNDPWASAFSAGASTLVPRDGVPDVFTSRIKRAFATAKTENQAIWTTNPARLSLFGPAHEICVFRDDISGRFRRSAVRIGQAVRKETATDAAVTPAPESQDTDGDITMSGAIPSSPPPHQDAEADSPPSPQSTSEESYATAQAKKLILTLLPQSTLSPFPLQLRPVHWDYAPSALALYPLPHCLVLADPGTEAFGLVFEGCCVVNPGRLCGGGKRVGWVEYDVWRKRGVVKDAWLG